MMVFTEADYRTGRERVRILTRRRGDLEVSASGAISAASSPAFHWFGRLGREAQGINARFSALWLWIARKLRAQSIVGSRERVKPGGDYASTGPVHPRDQRGGQTHFPRISAVVDRGKMRPLFAVPFSHLFAVPFSHVPQPEGSWITLYPCAH
jgi:hypothetical protein